MLMRTSSPCDMSDVIASVLELQPTVSHDPNEQMKALGPVRSARLPFVPLRCSPARLSGPETRHGLEGSSRGQRAQAGSTPGHEEPGRDPRWSSLTKGAGAACPHHRAPRAPLRSHATWERREFGLAESTSAASLLHLSVRNCSPPPPCLHLVLPQPRSQSLMVRRAKEGQAVPAAPRARLMACDTDMAPVGVNTWSFPRLLQEEGRHEPR